MVTIIRKGTKRQQLDEVLDKMVSTKVLDAKKFSGTIKLNEDPLEIQKKLRDEW